MSYLIFITGTISVPKGTEIPKKFKPAIAAEPYGYAFCADKKYDRYYVTMSVSSCSGSREDLKSYFMDMAKELKALSMSGMIVEDTNPEDYINWDNRENADDFENDDFFNHEEEG